MTDGVEVMARLDATVGECPVYLPDEDAVVCVDIPAGHLWRCAMNGTAERHAIGEPLGCVAPMAGGGFVLGRRTGVARLDACGATAVPWIALEAERPTGCNDGRCDPYGRFVVGTATVDGSVSGGLYLIDPDGTVTRLADGVGMSNGIDWSPDGRTVYYADSVARTVTRYPWDAEQGPLGPGTVIVALDAADGLPDGLTVDDDGAMWLAVWGAGQVRRYDPAGRPLGTLTFPTPQVTSCAFGGPRRDRLFVTSARSRLAPEHPGYRDAGALFFVDVPVTGPSPTLFGRARVRT